jgi:limonene-1,2-epoxide hydrolase
MLILAAAAVSTITIWADTPLALAGGGLLYSARRSGCTFESWREACLRAKIGGFLVAIALLGLFLPAVVVLSFAIIALSSWGGAVLQDRLSRGAGRRRP